MAITFSLTGDWLTALGSQRSTSGTFTIDTYSTAGHAVPAASVGLGLIEFFDPGQAQGGYIVQWDKTNNLVRLYRTGATTTAALAEVANSTTVNITVPFKAFGR